MGSVSKGNTLADKATQQAAISQISEAMVLWEEALLPHERPSYTQQTYRGKRQDAVLTIKVGRLPSMDHSGCHEVSSGRS